MTVDTLTGTKEEIIKAARTEFAAHGYEGARLQQIADRIGVTKAMIHYYFNTKKELFEQVYNESVEEIFGGFSTVLEKEVPLFQKIEDLIDECLQKSQGQPEILCFVFTESGRKTEWLIPLFEKQADINLKPLQAQMAKAASNYEIASVEASQLLLNIFSLCFYPVLSSPINHSLFKTNQSVNGNRKGIILDTILNWLTA
ncbi:MAG TPA: TetR/AcrR family transcriptional regulator [Balneolaceae bacterium]|nr:TetR/AcrR family transcriptional regulator [Balneolaceae bacterium]